MILGSGMAGIPLDIIWTSPDLTSCFVARRLSMLSGEGLALNATGALSTGGILVTRGKTRSMQGNG